jgi:peptidoglycan/LPS O-acetylase OafA/YrhL
MVLTPYDWVYGITQIATVFLSIIAGIIALGMFQHAIQRRYLAAWKPLVIALVLFAVEELLGILRTFGIWSTPYLTHVVPSFILVFLIAALLKQINITRGYEE